MKANFIPCVHYADIEIIAYDYAQSSKGWGSIDQAKNQEASEKIKIYRICPI